MHVCVLHLSVCMCAHMCIPVVFVGEVVYNGGADAGHAPLAVVPSSCDDRELRSTQTLLIFYTERGQRRTKHTHTHTHRNQLTGVSQHRSNTVLQTYPVLTKFRNRTDPITCCNYIEISHLSHCVSLDTIRSCKPQSWTFDTFTHSKHSIIILILHVY